MKRLIWPACVVLHGRRDWMPGTGYAWCPKCQDMRFRPPPETVYFGVSGALVFLGALIGLWAS